MVEVVSHQWDKREKPRHTLEVLVKFKEWDTFLKQVLLDLETLITDHNLCLSQNS
jgi:hypothetical protein